MANSRKEQMKQSAQIGFDTGYRKGFKEGEIVGRLDGFEYAVVLVLYWLKENRGWKDDSITKLHHGVNKLNEMIGGGYVSYQDIKDVLKNEHDLSFVWIDKAQTQTKMRLALNAPVAKAPPTFDQLLTEFVNKKGVGINN